MKSVVFAPVLINIYDQRSKIYDLKRKHKKC